MMMTVTSGGISMAAEAADVAAEQAAAGLPPRPSLNRVSSLARSSSLSLTSLSRPNITVYGWGRTTAGKCSSRLLSFQQAASAAKAVTPAT